jgi:hypothetical protein
MLPIQTAPAGLCKLNQLTLEPEFIGRVFQNESITEEVRINYFYKFSSE